MRDDAHDTPKGAGTMEAGVASNIAPLDDSRFYGPRRKRRGLFR